MSEMNIGGAGVKTSFDAKGPFFFFGGKKTAFELFTGDDVDGVPAKKAELL